MTSAATVPMTVATGGARDAEPREAEVPADEQIIKHDMTPLETRFVFMAILVFPAPRCAALMTMVSTLKTMPPR